MCVHWIHDYCFFMKSQNNNILICLDIIGFLSNSCHTLFPQGCSKVFVFKVGLEESLSFPQDWHYFDRNSGGWLVTKED